MASRPRVKTQKMLFALSGNRCAFPGCQRRLVDMEHLMVVGEICHIRAQGEGGPRYDPEQTEEARHELDNLMLMCPEHHKVIDEQPDSYPVEELQRIKEAHEAAHEGLLERLDERFTEDELRALLVEGGWKVEGDKTQLLLRLMHVDTEGAMAAVADIPLVDRTVWGQSFAERFVTEADERLEACVEAQETTEAAGEEQVTAKDAKDGQEGGVVKWVLLAVAAGILGNRADDIFVWLCERGRDGFLDWLERQGPRQEEAPQHTTPQLPGSADGTGGADSKGVGGGINGAVTGQAEEVRQPGAEAMTPARVLPPKMGVEKVAPETGDAQFHYGRGRRHAAKGDHTRAVDAYSKAIELDPTCAPAYTDRGDAYLDLGVALRALDDYNRAIELDPTCAPAYSNRGNAYRDLGKDLRALDDYNRAIELDPTYVRAYYNRALVYDDRQQYQRAFRDYYKALELSRDTVTVQGVSETGSSATCR